MRVVAVLVWGLSGATFAGSTFDIHGFGPRGVSMAGALTAEAHDYSAVFYNPALLASRSELNFGVGFTYMKPMTDVKSKDPSRELDCKYCQPEDVSGLSAGFLFPLAGKVQNRVALGVGIYVPTGKLVRAFAADPNRPSWHMYQGSPERLAAVLGLGVRIIDELRLGVGFQIIADLLGHGADMQVDLFSKSVQMRELDAHLASRGGLTAGVSFIPKPWLRFGLSYRGAIALDYRIPAHIDLTGVGVLNFVISGVTHYTPHTLTGGVAVDVTPELTVSLDGTYELWSLAPTPFVQLSVDVSGDTLRALGLDEAFNMSSDLNDPGFTNTLTGRLGLEYRVGTRFAVRAGGFYRPTHVPRQDVPGTNILDASTIGVAAGILVGFADPLEIFAKDVQIEVGGQYQQLLPRDANKEPTDSVPSYTYNARVLGLTAAVQYSF